MLKKAIPYIVIIGLVLIVVFSLIVIRKSVKSGGNPLKSIPHDAAVIVKINNYHEFFNKVTINSKLWEQLNLLPSINRLDKQVRFLDSLLLKNNHARKLLLNTPSYMSIHYTGRAKISYLHTISLPKGVTARQINDLITGLTDKSGEITQRKYEGKEIFDVRFFHENAVNSFSYSINEGLVMLSFSSILLEDAIRQAGLSKNILSDAGFRKVLSTAGKNVVANIFINYNYFPKLLSVFVGQPDKAEVRGLNYLAEWTELDVNLNNEVMLLNGFTFANDSIQKLVNLFLNQTPQKISIPKILPIQTSTFVAVGFENSTSYFEKYEQFLKSEGKLAVYQKNLDLMKTRYGIDVKDLFLSITDNEFCYVITNDQTKNKGSNFLFIIKTKSSSLAEKKLKLLSEAAAKKENINSAALSRQFSLDDETKYTISKIPVENLLMNVYGGFFDKIENPYYTFQNNYVIFCNSEAVLQEVLHSNVLHKTLVNDITYKKFSDNLAARSNVLLYSNLNRSVFAFSNFLDKKLIKNWETNIGVFQKVQALGIQLNSSGDKLYTNLALHYIQDYEESPHTVWETLLDTITDFKPKFVLNHYTKQNEIFVQDLNNTIYLINKAGRILWKARISEKIISDIYQLDYYKNGKLQLLFNTKNYLHMIDREGNYVENFPVKLRSPATNGISLFDYENNKNYRIFIACENKKVYAYSKDGKIISGWQFEQSEDVVNLPVNHFVVGDKDYIVFGDRFKTYMLDRRGDDRVKINQLMPKSENSNYFLGNSGNENKARIVTTDTSGLVYFFYLNGNVETLRLKEFSNEHYFEYKDVDGDGTDDFVFLDRNKLEVYKQNKSLLYIYEFKEDVSRKFVYFHFSAADRKIGIVSPGQNKIYLINNNGSLYKGFPLKGSTLFSIGFLGNGSSQFNLIVGNNDNFLYNYAVQ
ncbi:MAG: DUF3352 domain-containing protein [Bacteroidales bacterium]|nr:DUF3352 domain-containing protein [Bacteroidales bacterium]